MFEKKVEVTGKWRKYVNEFLDLYYSPHIMRAPNQGRCTMYGGGAIVQGFSGEA